MSLFPEKVNLRALKKNIMFVAGEVLTDESEMINTVNIKFCGDREIMSVNKQYLGHDYETDIITFKYTDSGFTESDILISVETVLRNSLEYKSSFINEVYRVVIHGLLHLCGYKDYSGAQKKTMTEKENFYLNKLISKGI